MVLEEEDSNIPASHESVQSGQEPMSGQLTEQLQLQEGMHSSSSPPSPNTTQAPTKPKTKKTPKRKTRNLFIISFFTSI